jgi:hypothetical protein
MPNHGAENQPSYTRFLCDNVDVDSGAAATLASYGAPKGVSLIYLRAHPDNTGNIAVGGSAVTATDGWILEPGDTSPPLVVDPEQVYVIAAVDNENLLIMAQY